jgi:transcriptional regulator with AAA-type ATPase domain
MAIADSLKQKRSIISHHLNNLHREQRVVKVMVARCCLPITACATTASRFGTANASIQACARSAG